MDPQIPATPRRPGKWAAALIIVACLPLVWLAVSSIRGEVPAEPPAASQPVEEARPPEPQAPAAQQPPEPLEQAKPEEDGPVLAIIIDDLGWGVAGTGELMDLRIPLTVAVIPGGPHSRTEADMGRAAGHEVILHLPMEPISSNGDLPDGTIRTGMDRDEIREILERHLEEIGPVPGFNNHTGSKATADYNVVNAVLEVAAERGLFAVDSRTSGKSVLAAAAFKAGVPAAQNRIFLDNQRELSHVKMQLMQAARIAEKRGAAIAIGHVNPITIKAISETVPEIEKMGIVLVRASRIVELESAPVLKTAEPRLK